MSDAIPDLDFLAVARKEMAEALGRYADGWSSTEGGVVTAFVTVAEVIMPDGSRGRMELSADGAGEALQSTAMKFGLLFGYLYDR